MIGTREWTQHILVKALCSPSRDAVNREIISEIKPDYFTSNTYRKSIRLIREHYEETGEFFTWSEFLKTEKLGESQAKKIRALEQRRKTLAKKDDSLLLPKKDKESYTTFIKRIQHDARHIKLIELQNTLSDKLETDMDEGSLEPLLNLVRDTVEEIDNLKINKGVLFKVNKGTIREKLKGFYKNLKENFFIPTGFSEFDELNIGIPLSSLFVMAAPTGCGKSSMCLQYLMNAVRAGAKVCLLPLEMSEEEMLLKMASNLLEVPTNELVRDLKRYYKKIVKALVKFLSESEGCFHFYTPDIDETLPMVLMKLKNNHYDIIAVDYINLLAGMEKEKWLALDAAGIYAKRFAGKYKTQIVFLAQLDKNTGDTRYSKALMEHACVTGDTLVDTPNGIFTIRDLVALERPGHVSISMPVQSAGGVELATCAHNNGKRPVYRLTTASGLEVTCTKDHKLMISKDGGKTWGWVELQDVKIGDRIKANLGGSKFPRKLVDLPPFANEKPHYVECKGKFYSSPAVKIPKKVTYELARLIGYWLGDSCVRGLEYEKYLVTFANTDKEIMNDYIRCFTKVFGIAPSMHKSGNMATCWNRNVVRFVTSIPGLNGKAHEKYIPDCILQSPKRIVCATIATMFDCNGYSRFDRKSYHSTSYEMIRRLQVLLMKLGIYSRYGIDTRNNNTHSWRDRYYLQIDGGVNHGKFVEQIKLCSRKQQYEAPKRLKTFSHYTEQEVKSIKYVGKRTVYDLTVPTTHCFVGNSLQIHNSNFWSWNHTAQDILENQRIDILQPKARGQNPRPFPLRANLACSKFTDYIEDMDDNYKKQQSYKKKGGSKQQPEALSKGFDGSGSDLPPDD